MDKRILDELANRGLITTVGVDASKFETVDDLIAKGIVTMPGAKKKITEVINSWLTEHDVVVDEGINTETEVKIEPIVEVVDDPAPVIDETPVTDKPIVDTPADETPLDVDGPAEEVETIVCDDPAEVEVTVVEDVDVKKSTRKSKKN